MTEFKRSKIPVDELEANMRERMLELQERIKGAGSHGILSTSPHYWKTLGRIDELKRMASAIGFKL